MIPNEGQQAVLDRSKRLGSFSFESYAGTGKTTISVGVVESIMKQYPDAKILVCSFSNAIINDTKAKLEKLKAKNVEARTVHSASMLSLRRLDFNHKLNNNFKLSEICENLFDQSRIHHKQKFKVSYAANKILAMHKKVAKSYMQGHPFTTGVDYGLLPGKVDETKFSDFLVRVRAEDFKYTMVGDVDFDDCLVAAVEKATQSGVTAEYDFVLVDEFQDCNQLQVEYFKSLGASTYITCFDRHQRIYGFNGALDDCILTGSADLGINERLLMNESFRCSHAVGEYVRNNYVDDFSTNVNNKEGLVIASKTVSDFLDLISTVIVDGAGKVFVTARTNSTLLEYFLVLVKNNIPADLENSGIVTTVKNLYIACARAGSTLDIMQADELSEIENNQFYSDVKKRVFSSSVTDKYMSAKILLDHLKTSSYEDAARKVISMFSGLKKSNNLIFATMHRTKGRESDIVIQLPYELKESSEEETLNLPYVGATRAKDTLYLIQDENK